jgi:hypothetical protein
VNRALEIAKTLFGTCHVLRTLPEPEQLEAREHVEYFEAEFAKFTEGELDALALGTIPAEVPNDALSATIRIRWAGCLAELMSLRTAFLAAEPGSAARIDDELGALLRELLEAIDASAAGRPS